jgi:hypothetical protein
VTVAEGRIAVERFVARYAIARDHPAPATVRRQLDEVVRTRVPDALADAVRRSVPPDADGLWLIRRLEIDLCLDPSEAPTRLATRWARAIAGALVAAMRAEGPGTVRFGDHAEHLGRFLVDACAGRAWDAWYHRKFDGLRALPLSGALRTAVVADAAVGLRALVGLAETERRRVIAALAPLDADRVARELAAAAPAAADEAEPLAAVHAVVEPRPSSLWTGDARDERAVLDLYLRTVAASPHAGGRAVLAAVRAVIALAALVREPEIVALRSAGVTVLQALGASLGRHRRHTRALGPILTAPPALAEALAASLERAAGVATASAADRSTLPVDEGAGVLSTAFGGLFMLLPLCAELGLDALAADWPAVEDVDAAIALRALVVAKAAGAQRASAVLADPAWQAALGLGRLGRAAVAAWGATLPEGTAARFDGYDPSQALERVPQVALRGWLPAPLDAAVGRATLALLEAFGRRLPGFAASSPPFLFANFLDVHATVEMRPEARIVRLGRPPLHVVLAMTGLGRARFVLPGADPRPFVLFVE